MRHIAFTLAEVLITLGIIGIVAALTLPTVINKIEKQVIKSQFRKAYSTLSQALSKTEADLGYKSQCAYGSLTIYDEDCPVLRNALEKNLKIVKVCRGNALRDGCFPKSSYEGIDTVKRINNPNITDSEIDYWKQNCGGFIKSRLEQNSIVYILNDGVVLILYGESPKIISVDVNGHKGPNKWGHDIFTFNIFTNNKKPLYLKPDNEYSCQPIEKGGTDTLTFIENL